MFIHCKYKQEHVYSLAAFIHPALLQFLVAASETVKMSGWTQWQLWMARHSPFLSVLIPVSRHDPYPVMWHEYTNRTAILKKPFDIYSKLPTGLIPQPLYQTVDRGRKNKIHMLTLTDNNESLQTHTPWPRPSARQQLLFTTLLLYPLKDNPTLSRVSSSASHEEEQCNSKKNKKLRRLWVRRPSWRRLSETLDSQQLSGRWN